MMMNNKLTKSKAFCHKKNIYILSDCFIPTRNSASGMIYNLSKSFSKDGAFVTCVHGGQNPIKKKKDFQYYDLRGLNFITSNFLINFRYKNLISRFIFEICLSIILTIKIICLFKRIKSIDLIIWYGPSAFLWLPALILKLVSKAPLYYILRDIFPDWLKSIGLVKNRILYFILNILTYPQYIFPDKIGVESEENLPLVVKKVYKKNITEVLYNWPSIYNLKNINISNILRKNVSNFIDFKKNNQILGIYAGNLSFAQDSNNVLNFLKKIKIENHLKVYFYLPKKTNKLKSNKAFNFVESVPEYELPYLFEHCNCGIVSLNKKLITNNIPGKFVSYIQFGLPILSFCNKKSKIATLINEYRCGIVIDYEDDLKLNLKKINSFCKKIKSKNNKYSINSKRLFLDYFNINKVKSRIIKII